ncbi:MAG TPA: LuxR family transcriptional regulator [Polyangiaceae bacterium]|nr:LuxR family transcriptional regulator [Polyangiaceae bacterium]
MDWSAVALLIAERAGLPVVVMSEASDVLLLSPAAEQALGIGAGSVGRNWLERYVEPKAVDSARWYLNKAFAGALRKLELPLRTNDAAGIAHFDAQPVGRDSDGVLLLLLERLVPVPREAATTDYDYEVTGVASGSLRLRRFRRAGMDLGAREGACFEALHGRDAPCEDCPLLRGKRAQPQEVIVRARPPSDYVVTTFSRPSEDDAHVSVRSLTMASLTAVLQAKLGELAERAHLSKRERAVFGHLMDGRAVEDIASDLQISPRTVKFHQANLLQKLGADSRADLMRLVF